jgi:uncharacterized membrane protein
VDQPEAAATVAGPPSQTVPVALDDNIASAMCYLLLGVTGLLFLVLEPYNRKRDIRFHALQSIFYTGALAVFWVVAIVVGMILAYIPWVGGMLAGLMFLAIFLGAFVVWILLMYKAYIGQPLALPWIGPLAQKQS